MRPDPSIRDSGFGKRGRVEINSSTSPRTPPDQQPSASPIVGNEVVKWAAGGIAAVFLLGLVTGGTGGGGLLGGLIGGLLGHKLANRTATPAASPAGQTASQSTTVQRGGFGSIGSSGAGAHSGGG